MNHGASAYFMATLLWLALMAFAVMGGADFGAGIWDLVARGHTVEQQRGALIRAIGPIWEGNEIWLIFLATGAWTAFPTAFSTVFTALFIPLTIALLGIVARGAAFEFYSHFRAILPVRMIWGRAFSVASLVGPFLFGCVAAAAADGSIRYQNGAVYTNVITNWTSPFALTCGCLAVSLSGCLAATFMTVEAYDQGLQRLLVIFQRRALITGAVSALLAAVAGFIAKFEAVYLFAGLTTRALPEALAAVVVGLMVATALILGYWRWARFLIALMVGLMLGTWAIAQLPYLIVPDITITGAASSTGVLNVMLIATIFSFVIVTPAYIYLLYIFKARNRALPPVTTNEHIATLEREDQEAVMLGIQPSLVQYTVVPGKSPPEKLAEDVKDTALKKENIGAAILATVMLALPLALNVFDRVRGKRHDDTGPPPSRGLHPLQ